MSEMGPESWSPDEAQSGVSEGLSEEAKQRFAAAAAAAKQVRKEEKKSKKKDDQVAKAIIQFLGDDKYSHLFVLIARLVARDCPSTFILAILSLIHKGALEEVEQYLQERLDTTAHDALDKNTAITSHTEMNEEMNRQLIDWILRLQMVLSLNPNDIMLKLMIDEKNVDGTVLQLATFVVQEFFKEHKQNTPFEKIQPLTASILQTVLEPYIGNARKKLLEMKKEESTEDED